MSENKGIDLNRIFSILLLVAAAVLIFIFCSRQVYESDTFLHLKTGQLIIERHSIPRTDPFSDANAGRKWINHESLSQVIFYILYKIGGPPALVIFCAFAVLVCFGFAVLSNANPRYPLTLFGLLLLGTITASERFQIRPEVFSMAMIGVFLFILDRYRTGKTERAIWLLPLLQIAWENAHGGTLLGPGLAGAYVAGEGAAILSSRFFIWPSVTLNRAKLKRLFIIFLLVTAACLVNPWGPMTFLLASELHSHSFAMSSIMEWQRTYHMFGQFMPLPVRIYPWLLGISGLSFILNFRRLSLSQLIIFSCLAILSLAARRNIALFAIVAVPFAAGNLSEFRESGLKPLFDNLTKARRRLPPIRAATRIAAGLCMVMACAWLMRELVTDRYNIKNRYFFRFGYGLSSTIRPWGLFDFMDGIELKGPGFNNHDLGAYLIWREFPRFKAFLDCRSSIYDPEFLDEYQDAARSASGFRLLAAKYPLNFAAVLHVAGDGGNFASILYQDPEWIPVYLDQAAVLFLRVLPENLDLINRYRLDLARGDGPAFSIENPTALDYANVGEFFRAVGLHERAEHYLEKAVEEMPDHPIFLDNLAKVKLVLGKYPEALPLARKALELDPGYAEAQMTLANAYYHLGQFEKAIKEFDGAISISAKNADAYSNKGIALLNLGRDAQAVICLEKAVEIDPDHKNARFNLALALEKMDDPRARAAWEEYLSFLKKSGAALREIREAEAHIAGRGE